MQTIRRRDFLAGGAAAAGLLAFGPGFWRNAFAAPATVGAGPYGPLQAADANGLMLPEGFTSRLVARAGSQVASTGYTWHAACDGQATYRTDDGGWVLVSNSETSAASGGGASAIRFAADGSVRSAYRICGGTSTNCAGGPTPWGTWLTCEEHSAGQVWECDPLGVRAAVNRPAMGVFTHEAVAVDPVNWHLYMTEDNPAGGLYRFAPFNYPELTAGRLEIAVVGSGGATTWAEVPDPSAVSGIPTRSQVAAATKFNGGEGIWFDSGVVYFSTKGDHKLWAYDTRTGVMETLYDPATGGDSGFLHGPDNLTVSRSGDLFVCEDNGEASFDVVMVTPERTLSSFLRATGAIHSDSELAGVVFSPDGERMFVASQRAWGSGAVFEVTGPFRPAPVQPGGGGEPGGNEREPEQQPGGGSGGGGGTETPGGGGGGVVTLPPAQQPGETVEDVDAPGLRLTVPRRVTLDQLRRGVAVVARLDEPGRVDVQLTTAELATERRDRRSAPRPKAVTLAKGGTSVRRGGGATKLTVRVKAAQLRRVEQALKTLKRRRKAAQLRARVIVQARDAAGNVTVANRVLLVTLPATRKAARARR